MTRQEWIKLIEDGRDILFEVDTVPLAIFTWVENGVGICRRYTGEDITVFSDVENLIDSYLVDGVPLSELIDQIRITEYS